MKNTMKNLSMLIPRSLKQLDNNIQNKEYEKAEAKLVDISSSLVVTYFIPTDSKFKHDLLPSILQKVLPITYNEQLNLRFQAESFLTHWYSLLSSFSPVYLLTVYQSLQTTTLQPAAQASLLTFLTNALHYISPNSREDYLGTCHSLLLSSQPEFLNHLTKSDWELLANTFSLQIIPAIVKFLLNSPLNIAVVTFLKKDPASTLPIILSGSNLQFLKELIPLIPANVQIPIEMLKGRLFEAINSQNSQEISGAIEIIILLINRPRLSEDKEIWKEIFNEVTNFWSTTKVVSQKSAIIDLFTYAAKFNMIPINVLHKFMYFDSSVPTVMSTSIIKCCAFYVKMEKKLPHGITSFLINNATERDPLLFVATIEFLVECFNEFYEILPRSAEKLLDLCINPLPQYFVEQIALIKLIKNINFDVFPESKLRTPILDIILNFINKPHPSVIPEIQSLIDQKKIILPYTKLDWYEKAPSYLTLLPYCDPLFIMELLDCNLLPAASYPSAIASIASELKDEDKPVAKKLFNRCLHVILEALHVLKIEYQRASSLKKSATKEWHHLCKGLPEMLAMINDNLPNTPFGKIIDSSLLLLASTIKYVEMSINRAIDLIEIAKVFGTAFTVNSCKIVEEVNRNFKDLKITSQISNFFTKTFPYDDSLYVSLSAIECLPKYQLECVNDHMNAAANTNRSIMLKVQQKKGLYNTFLGLKNDKSKEEFVQQCIQEIPFENWQIEEEDFEFISGLKEIHVKNLTFLDEIHRKVVDLYPESFIIENETKFDNSYIFEDLPETVNIGHEISDEFDQDLPLVERVIPPEVEPISPYKYVPPSKATLRSFLWFSKRTISEEDFQQIEKYALHETGVGDYKFALAFLGYAARLSLKIDIDAWLKILIVDRNNDTSVLSFVVLTTWIRKKWNELSKNELNYLQESMGDLGIHDLSEFNLVKTYKEEHGLLRMAAEAVISIDPSRYEEFPFFADIFLGKENFFQKLDSIIEMLQNEENAPLCYEAVSLMSTYLYPIPKLSRNDVYFMPKHVPILEKYFPTSILIQDFLVIEPPNEEIVDKLITLFENSRIADRFLFYVIAHFNITNEQYKRLIAPIRQMWTNCPYRVHLALKDLAVSESTTTITSQSSDDTKPPSCTRQLVSALTSPNCPKISSKDINNLCAKAKPVLFDLLFIGFDKFSEKLFDHNFKPNYTSGLIFQKQNMDVVIKLKTYLGQINSGGIIVARQFYQLDDKRLCNYFNTVSADAAMIEISEKIIDALIKRDCSTYYMIKYLKAVINNTPLMQMYMNIMKESVLNAPQLVNIFLIIHLFENHLNNSDDQNTKGLWEATKSSLPDKVKEKERADILFTDDPLRAFAKLLEKV
ncbi:hypothetical protein TRFO_23848 [Tritrichomonas foetus]|uniref:Uncharacterized protein n=1 Tax=Tritrichomonas foetus TaxID=1144522 RepID=A0A1J4K9B2_9EUKA|nr:hypothetical protein TRFO_23848 [Tritrichomonas foetus]|eukprot:OHT07811.1 hypothetical protein TRFO_23848 [Tritrichomonas foetus]